MKIGLTIDEVLRDTLAQLMEVYEKYDIGEGKFETIDDITTKNYEEYFPIKEGYTDLLNLNDLLYNKHSYEVFGAADFMCPNVMEPINEFIFDFYASKENKFVIISKEFNRSIQSTLHFLSKTNFGCRDVSLVESYKNIWDFYDVIITAEPEIIKSVPEGKTVIKINAPYNMDITTEYSFNELVEVFNKLDLEAL